MRVENPSRLGVIILAGGSATRFRDSDSRPHEIPRDKLQAEILPGITTIGMTISNLHKLGIPDGQIVVVASPTNEAFMRENHPGNLIVVQPEPLGNADAAAKAVPVIEEMKGLKEIVLLQGDDSYTYDREDYLQLIEEITNGADVAVMVLDPTKEWDKSTSDFWHVACEGREVKKIFKGDKGEEQDKAREKGLQLYALVNAFAIRPSFFVRYMTDLPRNEAEGGEKILPDFMALSIEQGGVIKAVPTNKFMGVNDYQQFLEAQESLSSVQ